MSKSVGRRIRSLLFALMTAFIYVGGTVGPDEPVTGLVLVKAVFLYSVIELAFIALDAVLALLQSREATHG